MAKQKYALNQGEKIVFKVEGVRHGFWGAYTHVLVVTNQAVILEKYGMLNNFKGIVRYQLEEINQAIIGNASNGEKQLELYFNDRTEDFAPQSGDDNVLKTLQMAIDDQKSENAECYDYNYYQSILDGSIAAEKEIEYSAKAMGNTNIENFDVQSGISFVGNVAKNVLKSGDISLKGVQKGISKATKKPVKKGIFGGIVDELLDDIGVHDIQDCFTEIGNDFREEFGMKPKMTHEERRRIKEQEEKKQKQELERKKREAYNQQVKKAKQKANTKNDNYDSASSEANNQKNEMKMSINEQLDTLKKLKELLDAGVLTKEEFDNKKSEIMNS